MLELQGSNYRRLSAAVALVLRGTGRESALRSPGVGASDGRTWNTEGVPEAGETLLGDSP